MRQLDASAAAAATTAYRQDGVVHFVVVDLARRLADLDDAALFADLDVGDDVRLDDGRHRHVVHQTLQRLHRLLRLHHRVLHRL